jgi:hypothetical protein
MPLAQPRAGAGDTLHCLPAGASPNNLAPVRRLAGALCWRTGARLVTVGVASVALVLFATRRKVLTEHMAFMRAISCHLCGILLKSAPSSQIRNYLMAKKALKRSWTPADLKTLRTLARKKTHAGRIARS